MNDQQWIMSIKIALFRVYRIDFHQGVFNSCYWSVISCQYLLILTQCSHWTFVLDCIVRFPLYWRFSTICCVMLMCMPFTHIIVNRISFWIAHAIYIWARNNAIGNKRSTIALGTWCRFIILHEWTTCEKIVWVSIVEYPLTSIHSFWVVDPHCVGYMDFHTQAFYR